MAYTIFIPKGTPHTMTNLQNLDQIIASLPAGVKPTITVLKTKGPSKGSSWCKANGPTPNVGLHQVSRVAGGNVTGNGAAKLA